MVRFRLRSLILFVTLIAGLLGWFLYRIRAVSVQRDIVTSLQEAGCEVKYWVPTNEADVYEEAFQAPGPRWLRDFLGDHFFSEGVSVDLPEAFDRAIQCGRGNGCFSFMIVEEDGSYDDIRGILQLRGLEFVTFRAETSDRIIAELRRQLPNVQIEIAKTKPGGTSKGNQE